MKKLLFKKTGMNNDYTGIKNRGKQTCTVKSRIARTIRSRKPARKWVRNTHFFYAVFLFKAFFFKRNRFICMRFVIFV